MEVDGNQNGSVDGTLCTHCGAALVPGAGRCSSCGTFTAGNQEARRLGLQARHHPPELREAADDLMAGIVADRGGQNDLSTLEKAYIGKIGDVEICLRILIEDIARHGLLTPGGRRRDSYDMLLAGLDRFDRYAQRIGIPRKARQIDLAKALSGLERR